MQLTDVLKEIVDRLLAGDWWRTSDDQDRFYYMIGVEAQQEHQDGTGVPFNTLTVSNPRRPSLLARWYRKAVVAGDHPDYVKQAKNAFRKAGAAPDAIDQLVEAGRNPDADEHALVQAMAGLGFPKATDPAFVPFVGAFTDLVDAVRLEKLHAHAGQLSADERQEVRGGLEAQYLKELSEKFPKLVDRAARMDPLSFSDPRLGEASRCYLYGFYRATVVLSAAALEAHLRDETGLTDRQDTTVLLEAAAARGLLDEARCEQARRVFWIRNRVLHDQAPAEFQEAEQALDYARGVIEVLVARR